MCCNVKLIQRPKFGLHYDATLVDVMKVGEAIWHFNMRSHGDRNDIPRRAVGRFAKNRKLNRVEFYVSGLNSAGENFAVDEEWLHDHVVAYETEFSS